MTLQRRIDKIEETMRIEIEGEYQAAFSDFAARLDQLRPELQQAFYRWLFRGLDIDLTQVDYELCGGRVEFTDDDQPLLDEIDRAIPSEVFARWAAASRRLDDFEAVRRD